ncbi:hypothetical protein GCM10011405_37290 [Rufibacter glacialis]|nr:hypothetical protein GCM10011405_37290 [Rufibacter glacialis]
MEFIAIVKKSLQTTLYKNHATADGLTRRLAQNVSNSLKTNLQIITYRNPDNEQTKYSNRTA